MIPAVVLAAGASRRLGSSKQLVRHRGRTLVRHAVEAAQGAGCPLVLVVTGADAERTAQAVEGTDAILVHNPMWSEGQATSVAAGVEALDVHAPDARGVLLLTCDQPLIESGPLRTLIEDWRASRRPMAACEYGGTLGVPAIFERSMFGALLDLRGDRGARDLLRAGGAPVCRVPWPEGAVDVDDEADVRTLPRSADET